MQAPELLRLLSEKTLDVYWSADAAGVLTYVAPQVRRLTGREPDELVGLSLRVCVHDQDAPESEALARLLLERRDECRIAYRLTRSEGDPVWVEATMHTVRSADGDVSGFIGTWHDITESRRVEVAYEHQAYHDTLTGLPNRR